MDLGGIMGLIVILGIFGTPIIAVLTSHHRKVLEMKLKAQEQTDASVLAELRELKSQMAELRDTTTRYDLSFDTALQRLEGRVRQIETRLGTDDSSLQARVTEGR